MNEEIEDCYLCDDTGRIECEQCDGSGLDDDANECEACDGEGSFLCEECDAAERRING